MMQNRANQKQLLNWINVVSFAVVDSTLYLDSHPTDKEAMEYFNHFSKLRNEALKEYSERFTPLTIDCVNEDEDNWKWVNDKWPWERGGC